MPGPAPKLPDERRRRNKPAAGEWVHAPGVGWRHGSVPKPPTGLLKASREAWSVWFAAWFASFWSPDDLPALRTVVRLYDAVERGELQRAPELRQQMDAFGVTPKGRQVLRWLPPLDDARGGSDASVGGGRYGHLRDVSA